MQITNIIPGALAAACLVLVGCGRPTTQVMHGNVTCGGEAVSAGRVSFVPMQNASGTIYTAPIIGGRYRVNLWGNAPRGTYRVEVDARQKTGRKVQGFNGVEKTIVDEEIQVGPAAYADDKSPLRAEVDADSDGQFDIALPRQ